MTATIFNFPTGALQASNARSKAPTSPCVVPAWVLKCYRSRRDTSVAQASQRPPNDCESVVEALEELLDAAKEGDIEGIVIAARMSEGDERLVVAGVRRRVDGGRTSQRLFVLFQLAMNWACRRPRGCNGVLNLE